MSLTLEQKQAHERYENADVLIRRTVDTAFTAARNAIAATGMDTAGDDRAEALVSAILVYIEESAE